MLIHIDWIIKAPTLPTDIKIQLLSITFILLSCDIAKLKIYTWGGKEKKKSYDTFFDFEILVFLELGANSAFFARGLTLIGTLKLTQEGFKNF